jgi:hypothetical protein
MSVPAAIATAKIQLPGLRSCCRRDSEGRLGEIWFGKLFAEAGLAGAPSIKHSVGGAFRLAIILSSLGGVSHETAGQCSLFKAELPSSHDDGSSLFADARCDLCS